MEVALPARAILQRFPDQKFSVALLCNSSAVNSQSLANKVTDIYLSSHYEDWEEEATDTEETIAYTAPAELNLGQYRGNYYSDEFENTIAIILSEDGDGIHFRCTTMRLGSYRKMTFSNTPTRYCLLNLAEVLMG